jgi:diguanylate cyclase (GGDEF)-like protein
MTVQIAVCVVAARGYARTAVTDIICALLMLSATAAFAANGISSEGRMRWFWMLQAVGWGLWLADQLLWVGYDVVLQKKLPVMFSGDALLFTAGVPMLAGLLLRPHLQPSHRSARLGALDFLLLLLWWLYLYVFFVICWQYVSASQVFYDRNYDLLYATGSVVICLVAAMLVRSSSGRWRRFYAYFLGAAVFNSAAFQVLNRAIERGTYFTGSWYDVAYCGSFAGFTAVALLGRGLSSAAEATENDRFASWVSNVAMIAVLSLPVIAGTALLHSGIPPRVARFRVLVTLATMLAMAFLTFVKQYRLNQELKRSNSVLEEASLTDPLTRVRNRRYFSATIEADIRQVLRSYTDAQDRRTRDLVFYLVDADDFKEINDRYGHVAGDAVLVEMARRISSAIRNSDVLVRWGGEEFLIVSRYTDRAEAEILAARVLESVSTDAYVAGPNRELIHRTCSIGWAAFPWFPDYPQAVSYEEVLNLADHGLGEAKRAGKNRAVGVLPEPGKTPHMGSDLSHSARLQVAALATLGPATTSPR